MATIPETLATALQYHQAGQLPEAEGIYRQILEAEPNHPDAWHLLGVVAHQRGEHETAIEHIRHAIALKDTDAAFYSNLGEVYRARGMFSEAVACYRKAIDLVPNLADAHSNLGLALQAQGERTEAIACYRRAIELKPAFPEAHSNLGIALQDEGQIAEAIASFHRAVELKPDFAMAQNNLGALLTLQGQYAEAITCFQQALQASPDFPDPHHNIGSALQDMGRAAEAVSWHERALQLKPDFAEAHNGLGNAYVRLGRIAEAIGCYQKALELKPDYADAHVGLGVAIQTQGQVREAMACYEQALQLQPEHGNAHLNRALTRLLTRDFERGWLEYEWRWKLKDMRPREFSQPPWDGGPLAGKTILLYAEQGLGDTVQFIRYTPLLKELGARVVVECQERLLPLLAHCPGVDEWVGHGFPLPPFDVHAPLLSLPRLFETCFENIPASIPYVSASPALVDQWRARLRSFAGFKVGISWQGNPTYRGDRCRSIPVGDFARLARVPNVCLISLQKGNGAEQLAEARELSCVVDFSSSMDEQAGAFGDTAAMMMNLGLVITSDSAIAHLAGSLGVPVWVALPIMPDWRWFLDREDSPWYPTMRLFRQKRFGDWDEVFERIAAELAAMVNGGQSATISHTSGETLPIWIPIPPGELLDKITILEIKRTRISDVEKLQNVQREFDQLCTVRDRVVAPSAELTDLSNRLATANEKLWEIEDQIRECEARKDFGPRFVELARAVYLTNDERAAIKRQINECLGSKLIEEKAYSSYALDQSKEMQA